MIFQHISGLGGVFEARAILGFEEIFREATSTLVTETVEWSATITKICFETCKDDAVYHAAESSSKIFLKEASKEIFKQGTGKMAPEAIKASLKSGGNTVTSELLKATATGGICEGAKAASKKAFKETARQQTKQRFLKGFLKNLPLLFEGVSFLAECRQPAIRLYRGEIGGDEFMRNVSESFLTTLSGIAGGFVGNSLGTMIGTAIGVPWCIPIAGFVGSILGGVYAGMAAKKLFSFF